MMKFYILIRSNCFFEIFNALWDTRLRINFVKVFRWILEEIIANNTFLFNFHDESFYVFGVIIKQNREELTYKLWDFFIMVIQFCVKEIDCFIDKFLILQEIISWAFFFFYLNNFMRNIPKRHPLLFIIWRDKRNETAPKFYYF